MERVQHLIDTVRGGPVGRLSAKTADDVVVTMAFRTPICRSRKGGYKDMRSDELMLATFEAARNRLGPRFDLNHIEDITMGTVLPHAAPYQARAAALAAGFPETAAVQIVNRFCSSGLMAVSTVANSIRNKEIDCGLAVGFESMTANPDRGVGEEGFNDVIMAHPVAKDCIHPMGWTSENVARDFNISREKMDEYAARSHQRASAAQKSGLFDKEIEPVEAWVSKGKTQDGKSLPRVKVLVSADDGIRHDTTSEKLAKIRVAFPQWPPSNTTGGNASQIADGGSGVLLMRRSKAEELGIPILGKHVATSVSGLAPRIMGIGPTLAIPKVLERTGLTAADVDLFEINEAFASMYVYCVEHLNLDPEKVNVNGGAIAFGHPLGCTGARQVATGLSELRRRKGKVLVTSMCIGLGMGAAAVFIAEY